MRALLLAVLATGCSKPSSTAARHDAGAIDPLAGIEITARDNGAGWMLHVQNRTANTISIVWNDSAYVDASGQSLGRVIPGTTHKGDVGHEVPDEPVPAGAFVDEFATTAQLVDWSDHYNAHKGSGRLSIALRIGDRRATWNGSGSYDVGQIPSVIPADAGVVVDAVAIDARRVPRWCFDFSNDNEHDTTCRPTKAACDDARIEALRRSDVTDCAERN